MQANAEPGAGIPVNEYLYDYFTKEEEFLSDYSPFGKAASALMQHDWQLNPTCSEVTRLQRDTLLQTGRLLALTFDAAAVYYVANELSSVRIVLRSSKRMVTVRVSIHDGELATEKIAERRFSERHYA